LRGLAPALITSLVVLAAAPSSAAPLVLEPRVPAGLLVITPPGRSPAVSTGVLLTAADAVLGARTRLELRSLEQLGVDPLALSPCREGLRLSCWARTIRAQASSAPPRFVFVLALLPIADGREQASLLLLDLERAAALSAEADVEDPEALAAVEDRLFAVTPRAPPARVSFSDPEARRVYFEGVVQDSFREVLERAGVFSPLGRIELTGTGEGWPVRVDGRPVGAAAQGRTEVSGVPVGELAVEVEVPWGAPVQARLTVTPEAAASLAIEPPPTTHPARVGVRWGGLGLAAVGVVVGAVGLAQAGDGARVTCLRRAGDEGGCAGLGTPTTGYSPSAVPATDPAVVDAGGLAIVPLGLALVTAGVGASVTAWLNEDEASFPWWAIAVGVVAGGMTYGVGHAVMR